MSEATASSSKHRMPGGETKLQNVQVLRGIASLAVVFFHLSLNNHVPFPAVVPTIMHYGKYGVQAFFVLSGFILPWSMNRSGYRLGDFGRFVLKRFLRLDPPYLLSIALSILFLEVAAHHGGEEVQITPFQVLAHLGYINVFFHMPWLNPVYWTLAVEMQFYLLIALIFPILNKHYLPFIFVALAAMQIAVPNQYFLPHHVSLFMLGTGIYLFRAGVVDRWFAITWIAGSIVISCVQPSWTNGSLALARQLTLPELVGAFAGAILLVAPNIKGGWLQWLGQISFSLYLVHYHVGNKTQSLLTWHLPWFVTYALGIAASIGVAYLLYRFVELPSQRWAGAVRYKSRTKTKPLDTTLPLSRAVG